MLTPQPIVVTFDGVLHLAYKPGTGCLKRCLLVRLLGQPHYTNGGRSFTIDTCEVIPAMGNYHVMLFHIQGPEQAFAMGIAFDHEIVGELQAAGLTVDAGGSLLDYGLAQLRRQLDLGYEQDGLVFESQFHGRSYTRLGPTLDRSHYA